MQIEPLPRFVKKRTTAKSRDLTSAFRSEEHCNTQIKTGIHLLFANYRVTSSNAKSLCFTEDTFMDR